MKLEEIQWHLSKNKKSVNYRMYEHLVKGRKDFEAWIEEYYSLPFNCERTFLMALLAAHCRANCNVTAPEEPQNGGAIKASARFFNWYMYFGEFYSMSANHRVDVNDYEALAKEAFEMTKKLWREEYEIDDRKFLVESDQPEISDLANRMVTYCEDVIKKMPKYKENFRNEWTDFKGWD